MLQCIPYEFLSVETHGKFFFICENFSKLNKIRIRLDFHLFRSNPQKVWVVQTFSLSKKLAAFANLFRFLYRGNPYDSWIQHPKEISWSAEVCYNNGNGKRFFRSNCLVGERLARKSISRYISTATPWWNFNYALIFVARANSNRKYSKLYLATPFANRKNSRRVPSTSTCCLVRSLSRSWSISSLPVVLSNVRSLHQFSKNGLRDEGDEDRRASRRVSVRK